MKNQLIIMENLYKQKEFEKGQILSEKFIKIFPHDVEASIWTVKFCIQNKNYMRGKEILINLFQHVDKSQNKKIRSQLKLLNLSKKNIDNHQVKPTILPLITVIITSCRRTDLLDRTLKSFLHYCKGLEYISEWILIDDNTPEHDLRPIIEKYNFLKVISKEEIDKGHARSLNIGIHGLKTMYTFILEDDWEFFGEFSLLDMINIIEEDPSYGQCLVNQNYMEEINDKISEGMYQKTKTGTRYILHDYCIDKGGTTTYWPHFSLRPGLNKTSILREFKFDENTPHFELDFSNKYVKKYKTCFLPGIYSLHIGRLTREHTLPNAYTLNNEKQFGKIYDPCHKDIELTKIYKYLNKSGIKLNTFFPKCIVLNMEQRKDRKEKIQKVMEKQFVPFEIHNAVVGTNVIPTRQFYQLFQNNQFQYRCGMVGCAISHIQIWMKLINDTCDHYLILEDDVELQPNFKLKVVDLFDKKWDIVFLGHHKKNKETKSGFLSSKESFDNSWGGTFGYIINKQAAIQIIRFIDKFGMINAIDTMMQRACDKMNILYLDEQLVTSEMVDYNNPNRGVDSDIQYDKKSMAMITETRMKEEMKTLKELRCEWKYISVKENLDGITIMKQTLFQTYNYEDVKEGHTYIVNDIVIFFPQYIVIQKPILKDIFVNYRLVDNGDIKLDMA